jgi:NADH:ubiquinone oxidoreductase subunit 2 (subunit N)
VAWHMWMREPRDGVSHEGVVTPLAMRFMLLAGVVLVLATGVLPGAVLDLAQMGADSLVNAGAGAAH